MAYSVGVILHFVESPIFSQQIGDLLSDEDQRKLQLFLLRQPKGGDLIKGSGGLRKLRWAAAGQGKRGGIRVIYYLWREDTTFMLMAYSKRKQEDLTPSQLKVLKELIRSYTNE